jgi:hypothetical protein
MDPRLRQLQAVKDRKAAEAARAAAQASGGLGACGRERATGQRRPRPDDDLGVRKFNADNSTFTVEYHSAFKNSPWVVVSNLPLDISEGDLASVAAQYGTVVDVRLDRFYRNKRRGGEEGASGPSGRAEGAFTSGRGFIAFGDCRSCVLVTDNLQGIVLTASKSSAGGAAQPDAAPAGGASSRPLKWDHCLEHQVPLLPLEVPTYAEWLHEQVKEEARIAASVMARKRERAARHWR